FAPIVRLITTSMVLLVRSDFPASTLKDFIAHAKSKPNGLSAGYGSAATIVSIAKLRAAAGFKTLDVPYKGVPLAITDVLGGQVDFTLGDLAVSMPQIHGGKMKGLGVTSPQRSPLAPELPAIAETFPGYETRIWYGLVAPAGTPRAVVTRVHDVVAASLARPDGKARVAGLGLGADAARRVRRLHQAGNRQVDEGDPRGGDPAGVIDAAIVGLGRWGRSLVESAQGKSDKLRFVVGVDPATDTAREFAAKHRFK